LFSGVLARFILNGKDMKKTGTRPIILMFSAVLLLGQLLIGSAYAIKNGAPDGDEHPYVYWIATWDGVTQYIYLGTGSLIAPTVVLTAGHITQPPGGIAMAWVSFDPETEWLIKDGAMVDPNSLGSIPVVSTHAHTSYRMGGDRGITNWITHDVGILILGEAIVSLPTAVLPSAGLVDTLRMKQGVDLVGYGVQYQIRGKGIPPSDNWAWIHLGYRYSATAQLIAGEDVFSDEFMRITANPAQGKGGTTFGDSGGPILLAGTNTVLGVCSWGTNGNCAGVSYEQRIDSPDILNWINSFPL
jgi:hypothetical protein